MCNKLFLFTTISIILAYFPCAAAETLYRDTPYSKFVAGGKKWTSEEGQNTRAKYVGEVSNGIPNGKGTIYFPGGDSYIGEFKGGRYDGLGTYIYANGSRKSGEWRAGELRFVLLHGQGTYTSKDNGQKYLGEFFYGKYHGLGTLEFADGSKYVGEFKDHNFHGQGTFSYPNGAVYVGEYKESKRDGQGTFRYPSGAAYVGEYKDGEWYGQGAFTFADGRKYVGEFKGQSYHGQGTFTYPNGAAYVGEYKEGKRYGQGTFTFADGRKIVGSWKSIPWEATGYSSTGLTLGYFSKGTFTGRDSSAINPIEYIEKLIDNLPISFDSVVSILQLPTTDR